VFLQTLVIEKCLRYTVTRILLFNNRVVLALYWMGSTRQQNCQAARCVINIL